MSYQTGVLTGTHQLPDGSPITGSVEVIPTEPRIVDSAGHVVISGRVKTALVDGTYSVTLPACDDSSLSPTGFRYLVKVNAINAKSFTLGPLNVTAGNTTHDDSAPNAANPTYTAASTSLTEDPNAPGLYLIGA